MGTADGDHDLTFRVNFTEEGISNLRETVRNKLKEFMGDYTDDTLVEYVIVLLRNGRRRDEAKNELDVFLGDDSDSFVSWLWDHLATNVDLYVQASDACTDGTAVKKSTTEDQDGDNESHHIDSKSGKHVENLPKRQHKRAWNDALENDVTKPKPLKSFVVSNMHLEERRSVASGNEHLEERTHHKVGRVRSPSPERRLHRKRSHPDEQQHAKRDIVSQANTDAPRRLLQFAVRDAVVGTLKPSGLVREPSLKRLRSVVSTSTGDTPVAEHTRRIQSIARVTNPMATVIKAVKEAAEDAQKVKSGRSVFDRLGRNDESELAEQGADFREDSVEDDKLADFELIQDQTYSNIHQRNEYSGHARNVSVLGGGNGMGSDSLSENEGYYNVGIAGDSATGLSRTGTSSGNKYENPSAMQYNVAKNADDIVHGARNISQAQTVSAVNSSHIASRASVNVNTWIPPSYQEVGFTEQKLNVLKSVQQNEAVAGKPDVQLMKENSNLVGVGNGNVYSAANVQKESQKTVASVTGAYSAGRPLEDADSRTIFISNVHFAATKDSLSRHFNKFGEVLKVNINTDPATGQPIGSAYVEFMRKEAADNALSLDGTSFMSRILKVVKRSSAQPEANSAMTWSRSARGSPYAPARLSRVPFPRGVPGAMRRGLSVKPGARSMQWKRDAQAAPAEIGNPVTANNVLTPTTRSLTYIRTEPKTVGNSNAT